MESRTESRWPALLIILAMFFLLAVLPERIRLLPLWIPVASGIAVIVPILGVALAAHKTRWLFVERSVTFFFFIFVGLGNIANLANLIIHMVQRSAGVTGLQLLTSSIAVWVTNVMAFSLAYWQMDRGGPEARAHKTGKMPDWLFPQEGAGEGAPEGWQPTFVDYLFLGFTAASSFSPTDTLPLTPRAKILMMLESSISLVTIVVVASRAINILGS